MLGRERAYQRLRQLLLSGRLHPDEPLSERVLAERLHMGRMPIREALKELAKEGLVHIARSRGAFVRQLTLDEIREVYEARQAVEGMGARLASLRGVTPELQAAGARMRSLRDHPEMTTEEVQRALMRFHRALVQASRNRELVRIYDSLMARTELSLRLTREYRSSRSWDAVEEHLDVLVAVERGDAARAEELIRYSLARALAARVQILESLTVQEGRRAAPQRLAPSGAA
jgi:DNA-binding GntR family transcriptional regulator